MQDQSHVEPLTNEERRAIDRLIIEDMAKQVGEACAEDPTLLLIIEREMRNGKGKQTVTRTQ